jgi:hypothetical protein
MKYPVNGSGGGAGDEAPAALPGTHRRWWPKSEAAAPTCPRHQLSESLGAIRVAAGVVVRRRHPGNHDTRRPSPVPTAPPSAPRCMGWHGEAAGRADAPQENEGSLCRRPVPRYAGAIPDGCPAPRVRPPSPGLSRPTGRPSQAVRPIHPLPLRGRGVTPRRLAPPAVPCVCCPSSGPPYPPWPT